MLSTLFMHAPARQLMTSQTNNDKYPLFISIFFYICFIVIFVLLNFIVAFFRLINVPIICEDDHVLLIPYPLDKLLKNQCFQLGILNRHLILTKHIVHEIEPYLMVL